MYREIAAPVFLRPLVDCFWADLYARLYARLCALERRRVDICALDVFHAAVAQAADPALPIERRRWWWWSRQRRALSSAAWPRSA